MHGWVVLSTEVVPSKIDVPDQWTHYLFQIPIAITSISSENHPVTVGVSDALYIDSLQFGECAHILLI
jgi:hypothetical protein